MDYKDTFQYWCENKYFDQATRDELHKIQDDEKEIEDRFYKDLEFGTGGLRGVIGAGTNRINIYTIRKATQGLANYIIRQGTDESGVAIAYDSRFMSPEFADEAALCLNANGIPAYVFESLRPTPELSFALRTLNCTAGIVITASHNPPEYNGYKVYWEDGAQIAPPRDKDIIGEVNAVIDYNTVKTMDKEKAAASGLYHVIGQEIDDLYMAELKKLSLNPEAIKEACNDLTIVYTPFHGTGNLPVQRILKELGFKKVYVVPEQEEPDPNFTTLEYPNPEDPKAFTLALKLAEEVGADIVLATDPDADRLGIYALDKKDNEYKAFTGNMSGLLICEYVLSQRKMKGLIPENGALVTTIVTTNMFYEVAKEYNLHLVETLTGFKYIGEQIKLFERDHSYVYQFGLEESYGCLVGTYARDKDAVSAVMMLCEAAAYYQTKGLTLCDQMEVLYEKYGYYKEGLRTMTYKGVDGVRQIQEIVDKYRVFNDTKFGPFEVLRIRDYQNNCIKDMKTGESRPTGLPQSNVIYFDLSDNSWCCVRPSGTEPKIKLYFGVKGDSHEDADEKLAGLEAAMVGIGS